MQHTSEDLSSSGSYSKTYSAENAVHDKLLYCLFSGFMPEMLRRKENTNPLGLLLCP